jgi:hypothetical protein
LRRGYRVLNFLRKYKFVSNVFHGRACALATRYNVPIGQPMKKPWSCSSTTNDMLIYVGLKCVGNHMHGECRGGDCKASEQYANDVVIAAREGFEMCCGDHVINTNMLDQDNIVGDSDVDGDHITSFLHPGDVDGGQFTCITDHDDALGKRATITMGSHHVHGDHVTCNDDSATTTMGSHHVNGDHVTCNDD